MTDNQPLLVIDTATRTPVVGLADADGRVIGEQAWQSRHRHGEELLQRLDGLLAQAGVGRSELAGVIVGTGPGSFTGLRIGLATAKTITYALEVPLIGVSTTRSLAMAARPDGASEICVTLPAGVADRYVHRFRVSGASVEETGPPQLVAGESAFNTAVDGATLVAVDLEAPDIPADALQRGQHGLAGLAAALAREGVARLSTGQSDDVEQLVPAYVALPRGIARAAEQIEWSPDLR